MERLKNKVAFITGGSRGMGRSIALRLAQEGANVVFTHSGKSQENADAVVDQVRKTGRRALAIVARNESPDELTNALVTASKEFGNIDILVNNAGVFSVTPIADLTVKDYDQTMNVNTKAIFITSQYASKHMKDGGRIINIGSNLAERVSWPGLSLYSMSKSALIGLTKGLARELGDRNISVNLIQPGSTNTDMNPEDGDMAADQKNLMAIRRFTQPQEIAGMVAYLASDESQMITGATVTMDGGANI